MASRFTKNGLILAFVALGIVIFTALRKHQAERSVPSREKISAHGPRERFVEVIPDSEDNIQPRLTAQASRRSEPLTPERASLLMSRIISSVPDLEKRAEAMSKILVELCERGYGEEAWGLIQNEQGLVRDTQIKAIFFGDRHSATDRLLVRLGTLAQERDRVSALKGLITGRPSEVARTGLLGIPLSSKQEKDAVTSSLSSAINDQISGTAASKEIASSLLKQAFQLVDSGSLSPQHLMSIVNTDSVNTGFDQWSMVEKIGESVGAAKIEELRSVIVRNMIAEDPRKAMDLVCSGSSSKQSYKIIGASIETLYQKDPKFAAEWVNKNIGNLESGAREAVISGIAGVALARNELSTARQWAEQMVDEEEKEKIIRKIEAIENPVDLPK